MAVSAELVGTELQLVIDGVFDIELYHEFNNSYKHYLEQAQSVVIDFAKTQRIDSAALGLILLLREQFGAEKSNISLINPNPTVLKSLQIAQMQNLFKVQVS